METDLPKGYTCACGEYHKYPGYIYAHFREMIDHTCPKCRRVYTILLGHATPKRKKRAKNKEPQD